MRKVVQAFLLGVLTVCAIPAIAQESHGMLSVSSALSTQYDNNKQQIINAKFEVGQNSPNPFSDYTQIEFGSASQGFVEFKIVNLLGKEVFHRVIETEIGRNTIRFEAEDFLPGVYIYSLSNGSQTLTRRMVISKK